MFLSVEVAEDVKKTPENVYGKIITSYHRKRYMGTALYRQLNERPHA